MSITNKLAIMRTRGAQGDPGLFRTLGKAFGTALSVAGPPGTGSFWSKLTQRRGALGPNPLPGPNMGGTPFGMPFRPGSGGFPGLPTDFGMSGMTGSRAGLKKDGSPRRIKKNGQFWKRPSMNFANGRAIKRASRRLEGAEKMFKKVFTIRHGGHAPAVHLKKAKGR